MQKLLNFIKRYFVLTFVSLVIIFFGTIYVLQIFKDDIGKKLLFIDVLENKIYDYKIKVRGVRPLKNPREDTDIVILTVDDKSIEKLGRWPWPRSMIAQTVDKLSSFEAKTIVFDSFFSEQDMNLSLIHI